MFCCSALNCRQRLRNTTWIDTLCCCCCLQVSVFKSDLKCACPRIVFTTAFIKEFMDFPFLGPNRKRKANFMASQFSYFVRGNHRFLLFCCHRNSPGLIPVSIQFTFFIDKDVKLYQYVLNGQSSPDNQILIINGTILTYPASRFIYSLRVLTLLLFFVICPAFFLF